MKIQVDSLICTWYANICIVCWVWLTSVLCRLDSSHWYFREWLRYRLCMEELVDNVMYRIFIYTQSPCANGPKYYKLGTSKTVRFPRQGTECLTKLPENVSKIHIPFLHRDFFFIAFLVSTDPWWLVYYIPKIGQGRNGFSFKDYCFDNLVQWNISAFLRHLRTCFLLAPEL